MLRNGHLIIITDSIASNCGCKIKKVKFMAGTVVEPANVIGNNGIVNTKFLLIMTAELGNM